MSTPLPSSIMQPKQSFKASTDKSASASFGDVNLDIAPVATSTGGNSVIDVSGINFPSFSDFRNNGQSQNMVLIGIGVALVIGLIWLNKKS